MAGNTERRLATVLVADAVGFSRRMGRNEDETLASLIECRALMSDIVAGHRGKIIGTPGDFFLAIMPSGLEAIESAIEIQTRLAERNRSLDEVRRAEYRIGVGIGDIREHQGDVLGDAVNVASRLQGIAQPGGVVVSGAVRDIVGRTARFVFNYLGDQALKNIDQPVRAYSVSLPTGGASPVPGLGAEALRSLSAPRPIKPIVEIENFRTLSENEEERVVAEGLTEELLTILVGLNNSLTVRQAGAGRGAAFGPRGERPLVYRLSGRIRRATDGIRINARLVVEDTGEAIWAARYEYQPNQSFDAHELIGREVVTALQVTLTEGEQAHLWRRGTTNVRAWELFQRGHDLERRVTRHGHREARLCYEAALAEDPSYISAMVALGFCHLDEIRLGWTTDEAISFAAAESLHVKAINLDPTHPECHALQAYMELHRRNDEAAVKAMEEAVRLAPRNAELVGYLGMIYDTLGRFPEAIANYHRAMTLSPHFPAWIATNLGYALCVTNHLEEARTSLIGVLGHYPEYVRAHLGLAVVYRRLGLMEDAGRAAEAVKRLDPLFRTADWARDRPFATAEVTDAFIADMRATGLD